MNQKDVRILNYFAIVGFIILLAGTLIAIQQAYPWFDWLHSHLSDLGNPVMIEGSSGYPGENPAAIWFNGGLVIGGMLLAVFSYRLVLESRKMPSEMGKKAFAGSIFFALGMVFLMLVGVYNSSYTGGIHVLEAILFFVFFFLASMLFGSIYVKNKKTKAIGYSAFIFVILSLLVWLVTFMGVSPWTKNAIPEAVSVITTMIWVVLLSWKFIKNEEIKY